MVQSRQLAFPQQGNATASKSQNVRSHRQSVKLVSTAFETNRIASHYGAHYLAHIEVFTGADLSQTTRWQHTGNETNRRSAPR